MAQVTFLPLTFIVKLLEFYLICEYQVSFLNVGPNLANNIPQINDDSVTNYITGSYPNSMSILESTHNEIINIVNLLKYGSSVGIDEISSVVVKAVILEISKPLNTIINLSLKSGQFPNQLKIAKFLPIYKSSGKKSYAITAQYQFSHSFQFFLESVV